MELKVDQGCKPSGKQRVSHEGDHSGDKPEITTKTRTPWLLMFFNNPFANALCCGVSVQGVRGLQYRSSHDLTPSFESPMLSCDEPPCCTGTLIAGLYQVQKI